MKLSHVWELGVLSLAGARAVYRKAVRDSSARADKRRVLGSGSLACGRTRTRRAPFHVIFCLRKSSLVSSPEVKLNAC